MLLISQYGTYTLLQNDNFIRILFVDRLLSRGWQYSHANERKTVTAKEDLKQKFSCCDIIWTLISWFSSSSNFLESLTPQSFQEQVMTYWSCNYTIWERKKYWIQLYLNLFQHLSLHNLFHLVHDKLQWWTCVPLKVRRSPKLRGVRRSPELFARSTDFRVPGTLISRAQSTCAKGKLLFAR